MWNRFAAELLFVLHFIVLVLVLFGWLWPGAWWLYGAVLFGVMGSWIFLGRCVLMDAENYFRLRSHLKTIPEGVFFGYWGARLFGDRPPSVGLVKLLGGTLLLVSSGVWIYKFLLY